jgi:uncharacterized membrane protein YgcG
VSPRSISELFFSSQAAQAEVVGVQLTAFSAPSIATVLLKVGAVKGGAVTGEYSGSSGSSGSNGSSGSSGSSQW